MKYMLLINLGPKGRDPQLLSVDERNAFYAGWGEFNQLPGVTPGEQLGAPDTATTVRSQDGDTLTTDGPFVDTKEALDGWCFVEADDLDAAIAIAAQIPAVKVGGAVEVRPVTER